ncbi:MAG: hypothetical protein VX835_00660 [Pseudomonadota bacterium]|nr:hypothetical protein [Pseudomonadota bacterium]
MGKIFFAELQILFRDWWFWFIQIIQPSMVVLSIFFLLGSQDISKSTSEILNFSLLWVMSIWLQLSAMNLIWKNDFPLHAWQLSYYRLSTHAFLRLVAFFMVCILPSIFLLFLVIYGSAFPSALFLGVILVQAICLQFSCILGYMLKLSNRLNGLGALFLMPIFLPLNLIPAGAFLINDSNLIEFSILFVTGVGFLGSVVYILFFDGVLKHSV